MFRRFAALACAVVLVMSFVPFPSTASAQSASCNQFDAWIWAQTAYESDPDAYGDALDPDGNELACENLPVSGFAPVLWTDEIPASAEAAQLLRITDGDTFHVSVNGQEDTVRMYHIDTPERDHCGYTSASQYLEYVLGFAPGGTVYLEYDQTERDEYDRRLAYVWYETGGDVYLVNEVMARNGWAESDTFKPDDKYKTELDAAEQFSVYHVLGVRMECGKFNQTADATPSRQQQRDATNRQPNQGQFYWLATGNGGGGSEDPGNNLPSDGADPGEEAPYVEPTEEPQQAPPSGGDCDSSYPDVCIPPRSQAGDLDCGDVSYRRFTVLQPDPHQFDGDFDGVGCES